MAAGASGMSTGIAGLGQFFLDFGEIFIEPRENTLENMAEMAGDARGVGVGLVIADAMRPNNSIRSSNLFPINGFDGAPFFDGIPFPIPFMDGGPLREEDKAELREKLTKLLCECDDEEN